jgi:hypothetical protein
MPDVIHIEAPPTHCDGCGAEYENIGHPMKPGVIVMRVCRCEVVTQPIKNGTITMLIPPTKPNG